MLITDARNSFLIFLEANGRSPRTIDGYRRDLDMLNLATLRRLARKKRIKNQPA